MHKKIIQSHFYHKNSRKIGKDLKDNRYDQKFRKIWLMDIQLKE